MSIENPEPGDKVSGVDAGNGANREGTYVRDDELGTAIVRNDKTGKQRFVSKDTMRKK
jgi:hypothetical protein